MFYRLIGLSRRYAGHGSGSAYLPLKELRKFGSPPSVFLMGCSSGRPVSMGCAFDSTAATVEAYLFSKRYESRENFHLFDQLFMRVVRCVVVHWPTGAELRKVSTLNP